VDLHWLRSHEAGRAWLAAAPAHVAGIAADWQLRLEPPFEDAHEALTYPATDADGRPVALKVQYPNRESSHEADALAAWNGDGAVQLLRHDRERHALLLERALPGDTLATAPRDEALDALVDLLPRLWIAAGPPFPPLAGEAVLLAAELEREWARFGKPFERRLVDLGVDAFATLAPTQGPPVLLHQDLHGDNVLAAQRKPWLVIDPKPLAGEREFGLAPIVRSPELGHSRADVWHRLDRLSADLGLDRERSRLWTVAHTLGWIFSEDGVIATHLDTVRWLTEPRPPTQTATAAGPSPRT
jgi:streptomycin 6-kinase